MLSQTLSCPAQRVLLLILAMLQPDPLGALSLSLMHMWPFLGVRIRGTLGDIDPLNKVPFKRATSRVQKGPLKGSP